MAKDILTDEDVELEIERLKNSEAVILAQAERKFKYRRRQYLYTLRWYEKRGNQLMAQGMTPDDFKVSEIEKEMEVQEWQGRDKLL